MIERFFWIICSLWLLLVLAAMCRVWGFLWAKGKQTKLWGAGSSNQRPVVVIVAIKGFDPRATPRFFASILAQNYSNYRIVVAFENGRETVAQWLKDQFHLSDGPIQTWESPEQEKSGNGLKSVTLVEAGQSSNQGQKVHNQLAALNALTPHDEVIAFVDSDIVCPVDWLARLTAPVNQRTHDLSTTYRWLVPRFPTFPNHLASVINASIATQGGSEWSNLLWGGSMALPRKIYDSLDVPNLFQGSLNDDLRLCKAARQAGYSIASVRSLILPTKVDFNWRSLFEFGRRQYTQVKFFAPVMYIATNLTLGFYVFGLFSIIFGIWWGYFPAWIPMAAAYVIDQFRAVARQQIYLSLFKEEGIRKRLIAASWMEHLMTPFCMVLHWLIIVSTWNKRTIKWAGISYQILSPSKTRILSREKEVFAPVPAAATSLEVSFPVETPQKGGARAISPAAKDLHLLDEEADAVLETVSGSADPRGSTGSVGGPDPVGRGKTAKGGRSQKSKPEKKQKPGQLIRSDFQQPAIVTPLGRRPAPSKIPHQLRVARTRKATLARQGEKSVIRRKKMGMLLRSKGRIRHETGAISRPEKSVAQRNTPRLPVSYRVRPEPVRPFPSLSRAQKGRAQKRKGIKVAPGIPRRIFPSLQKKKKLSRV